MNAFRYVKIGTVIVAVFLTACRGQTMKTPPIHPNMNMDQQNRVEAQERVEFFTDNRAMRQPVEGTVARGDLRQNTVLYQGINEDSTFVADNPMEITKEFLLRGQNQYNVYCTPCHGMVGDGQGIVATGNYGLVPPPSYHQERLRNIEDGYLFSVITNGIRTMRPYAHQITVEDRWAIVAYIRALQQSQNVQEGEIQQYDVDLAAMQEEAKKKLAEEEAAQQAQATTGGEVTAAKGKELAQSNTCLTCHSTDGSKLIGPTWQGLYGSERELQSGETVIADEEYLTESIVNASAKAVVGFQKGAMTNFDYLSSNDVDNIVAFIKSLSEKTLKESSSDTSAANSN